MQARIDDLISDNSEKAVTTRTNPSRPIPGALFLAGGTIGIGQSVLFMMMPLLVEQTGIDLSGLTFAMAVGTLVFLIGAPFWGRRSDVAGRGKTLFVVLAGSLCAHAGFTLAVWLAASGLLAPDLCFLAICAARVSYGLFASGIHPVAQAWVADLTGRKHRVKGLARLSASISMGRICGPALASATLLAGGMGPLLLLLVAPLPALCLLRWNGRSDTAAGSGGTVVGARRRLSPIEPRIVPFVLFAYLAHTAFGLVQFSVGLFLQQRLSVSGQDAAAILGMLMTLAALAMVALQLGLLQKYSPSPRRLVLWGATLLAIAVVLIAASDTVPAFAGGLVLFAVATGCLVPGNTAACSLAVGPQEQGSMAGLLAMAHTLGYASGALAAGLAFPFASVLPFVMAIVIAVSLIGLGTRHPVHACR